MECADRHRGDPAQPAEALPDGDAEVDRLLVAGTTVERDGDHYRILDPVESWDELEALARRTGGVCGCGAVLSQLDGATYCPRCERSS